MRKTPRRRSATPGSSFAAFTHEIDRSSAQISLLCGGGQGRPDREYIWRAEVERLLWKSPPATDLRMKLTADGHVFEFLVPIAYAEDFAGLLNRVVEHAKQKGMLEVES